MATSRLTWACLYPLVESAQTFYDLRGGALDWPTLFQLVDWVDSVRSDQLYIEGTTDGTDFVLGIEGGEAGRVVLTLRFAGSGFNCLRGGSDGDGTPWQWIPSGGNRTAGINTVGRGSF